MKLTATEIALAQRLEAMPNCPPIAWPNRVFNTPPPYLEFRHSSTAVNDESLDGTRPYRMGLALVTVIIAADQFTTPANTIADAIEEHFPKGLRLPITGGEVLITKPSEAVPGFMDGVYWRIPVRITYQTAPTS